MKPQYIILLLSAAFITLLADGISVALAPIPGVGIILALAITFCINATMGAGIIIALGFFDMYHPRFSPFGIIGGLIPGLNFLPFWVGLVAAGIIYKMNAEGEDLGGISKVALNLQSTYQGGGTPLSKFRAAKGIIMSERRATGRPPQAQDEEGQEEAREEKSRNKLKSPSLASRMNDIAPVRNKTYAKAA